MKFTAAILATVMTTMVSAMPQSNTANAPSSITAAPTAPAPQDPAQASTLSCISACGPGNVYCQAACQGLPTPDETAVNATHDCVEACPPGGDDAKNAAWAACQASCVAEFYWTASTPWGTYTIPGVTTVTNTEAQATETDASETSTETDGSKTSGPSSTQTPNAGSAVYVNMPILGALGLLLGVFAL